MVYLCHIAVEDDRSKAYAELEVTPVNFVILFGMSLLCREVQPEKSIASNACYTIGDVDVLQGGAAREYILAGF